MLTNAIKLSQIVWDVYEDKPESEMAWYICKVSVLCWHRLPPRCALALVQPCSFFTCATWVHLISGLISFPPFWSQHCWTGIPVHFTLELLHIESPIFIMPPITNLSLVPRH